MMTASKRLRNPPANPRRRKGTIAPRLPARCRRRMHSDASICTLPLPLAEARTTLAETAERVRKVPGISSSLFAAEVVECVAEGRAPTTQELYAVAERIGRDSGMGPIFAWGDSAAAGAEERYLLRAAHAALQGTDARP